MSLDIQPILDALVSHAAATGHFERVNQHEPKSAPGNGLTAALWSQTIAPAIGASGLDSTTIRIEFALRIFQNMLMQPQDAIDPRVLAATSALMTAYSGDLELGGLVRDVDLLGTHGAPLSAQAGYVPIDNKMFRVMTITIPLIINDVFEQEP